jgi:DNA-binding GntR family transcriptional regulator
MTILDDKTGVTWNLARKRRKSLHEELVDDITEMIQEGKLPPGSQVPEVALCGHFNVSRTPLREALKVLAAEGWVVWKSNYGARVSEVDPEETLAVFETQSALERQIGHLIVERITDAEAEEIYQMHKDLIRHHSAGNRDAYFRANQAIHQFMATCTKNQVLANTYCALSRKIYRARAMANYEQYRWDQSLLEHENFMITLRKRDGERLAQQLVLHNDATCAAVIRGLRAGNRDKVTSP